MRVASRLLILEPMQLRAADAAVGIAVAAATCLITAFAVEDGDPTAFGLVLCAVPGLALVLRRSFPVAQYVVRHDGRFVARTDFAWPEHRLALEYDGLWHGEPGQFQRDRATT